MTPLIADKPRRPRLRQVLASVPFVILFSISFLLAAEFSLRLTHRAAAEPALRGDSLFSVHDPPGPLYMPTPLASMKAYGVDNRINSLGFRDSEYPLKKEKGDKRILFLGDSVVYGTGLEQDQTLPKQIERIFVRNKERVEVMNLGVPGYDTEAAIAFFERAGRKLKPDLVVLGYTLDDSRDASPELDALAAGNTKVHIASTQSIKNHVIHFLRNHSSLYQSANNHFQFEQRIPSLATEQTEKLSDYLLSRTSSIQDPEDSAYRNLKSEIEKDFQHFKTDDKEKAAMLKILGLASESGAGSHWNQSKTALLQLKELAAKDGFDIAVVIFPYMTDLSSYPLGSVHGFLGREFAEMGFAVIDLLPFMRAISRHESGITTDSIHFSAMGTSLAGDYLHKKLYEISGSGEEKMSLRMK